MSIRARKFRTLLAKITRGKYAAALDDPRARAILSIALELGRSHQREIVELTDDVLLRHLQQRPTTVDEWNLENALLREFDEARLEKESFPKSLDRIEHFARLVLATTEKE